MGIGGNGNSPHGNPIGMGISQKIGNGMGGNGNVESHPRTSLQDSVALTRADGTAQ